MDKVSEIVAELQICYATEIEVIHNYLANAIDLEGSRAEPIKALFDDEVQTALAHARRLAKRIKALEGRILRYFARSNRKMSPLLNMSESFSSVTVTIS